MRRYFLTGCGGLIGREIIRQLIKREDTDEIYVLTRDPQRRYEMYAWSPKIRLYEGDITETQLPQSDFTDLIHGANEVNDLRQPDQPRYYYTIVEGTARVMDWAANHVTGSSLLLSSGAATRDTVYGRAKRQSERIMRDLPRSYSIARIFSVLGEEMPLNGQYAAGIFIHQAIADKVVRYYGGNSERSYLHVEDAARWILTILDHGSHGRVYDVAGENPITMYGLAYVVADVFGVHCEKVEGPNRQDTYLPDLTAAKNLGLSQTIGIRQSLERIRDYLCH